MFLNKMDPTELRESLTVSQCIFIEAELVSSGASVCFCPEGAAPSMTLGKSGAELRGHAGDRSREEPPGRGDRNVTCPGLCKPSLPAKAEGMEPS